MKLNVKTAKPRNPLVVPARARKAGAHGPSRSAQRQQAREALRREIRQLPPVP